MFMRDLDKHKSWHFPGDVSSPGFRGTHRFTAPHIGVDGRWRAIGPWRDAPERQRTHGNDPFAKKTKLPPRKLTFRHFFPFQLSADGLRARVGWEESAWSVRPYGQSFDVEVRKINGQWTPVECIKVCDTYSFWRRIIAVPRVSQREGLATKI